MKQKSFAFIMLALLIVASFAFSGGKFGQIFSKSYLDDMRKMGKSDIEESDDDEEIEPHKEGIVLSHNEFFYSSDIDVAISTSNRRLKNADIYYTTDGSDPTVEKGKKYDEPIKLTAGNRTRATALRIKAFYKDGSEDSLTHTYFVGKDVGERFNTLVFSLTTDPHGLYDYEYGIMVEGKLRDEYKKETGDMNPDPPAPANYNMRGIESERPVYVEVFEQDGTRVISQGAGIRVHGGWSRANDPRSFRLIARKIYDTDGKFKYNFLPGDNANDEYGTPITQYDRVVLRTSANDRPYAFLRDELSAQLAKEAGFPDTQGHTPVAVFLNGKYHGFAWLHESYDDNYLKDTYRAPDKNFAIMDIYENNESYSYGVARGEDSVYNDFDKMYSYHKKDLRNDEVFAELEELLDVDNYLMFCAIQTFIDNRDWPRGNQKAWRYYPQEDAPTENKYLDGRWRYLLYDAEFAWGLYGAPPNQNTIERLLGLNHDEGGGTVLFKALMERDDVVKKFANILCDLAYGAMSPQNVSDAIDEKMKLMYNELTTSYRNNIYEWGDINYVESQHRDIKTFANRRFTHIVSSLKNLYDYTDMYEINVKGDDGARIRLNTRELIGDGEIKNRYFVENAITVSAEPIEGFAFSHMIINGERIDENTVELSYADAIDGTVKVEVIMERIDEDGLKITRIYNKGSDEWVEIHNPTNEKISTKGLFLSDNPGKLDKWAFPTTTIEPGGSLLLVGKNNRKSYALKRISYDFGIKTGETIFLSRANREIISFVTVPQLGKSYVYQYDYISGKYEIKDYNEKKDSPFIK